jgi:nicotinamide-nucleotide amidase
MRGAVLSVGDELITGESLDTNAQWISARLAERGVSPLEHRTVGDDRARLSGTIGELAAVSDVLVLTGGLGPTADDLTRFALGDLTDPGRELVTDPAAVEHLERRYAGRGRPMPASNLVQALRPPSARLVPNPQGTAMGLAAEVGTCRVFALPGPPREMEPMLLEHVLSALPVERPDVALALRRVHCFGLGESAAAERLGELTDRGRVPQVGITVSDGIVTARIRIVSDPRDAAERIEPVRRRILDAWAPYAFGEDEQTLPIVLGAMLQERGETVATAESCTGGWVGKMLVDVPGSSAHYLGGWVTYTNGLKTSSLGVDAGLIETHGAVSAPVAVAMARGAVAAAAASHAIAITGVAGPTGGTDAKPVGTVFVAVAHAGGAEPLVRRFRVAGDRTAVRRRAALSALQLLRLRLLGPDDPPPLLWEQPMRTLP